MTRRRDAVPMARDLARPAVSVIVPALDEERELPATLRSVAAQGVPAEVIVVDGGSADATRDVARALGAKLVAAPRGRASQMNAGALASAGEWLLFLHADTRLPPGALAAIASLPAQVEAGCFRQAFDAPGRLLGLTSRLHNWRCARTRVMYGDQAMFVRRAAFEAVGGFPEGPLEDVRISERLLERASPAFLALTVETSARRFLAQGPLACLARIAVLLLQHRLGLPLFAGGRFFEPVR